MKLITAIIRPKKLSDVKRARFKVGVPGITLSRASGHGGERDVVQRYRADTVVMEFHEKVRIEMAVSEPWVDTPDFSHRTRSSPNHDGIRPGALTD